MIAKVNLLPWREEKRKRHERRFVAILLLCVICVVSVQWSVASYLEAQIHHQQQRNYQLNTEVTRLRAKYGEVISLGEQREQLTSRLAVIAGIEQGRNRVTRLLSLLPSWIPAGVYVHKLTLQGDQINVEGKSDSNARLANLLAKVEASPWLSEVAMHSIIADQKESGQGMTQFSVSFIFSSMLEQQHD